MEKENGKLAHHAETLLMAGPEMVESLRKKLGTEIRKVAADPESAKHFRETASMAPRAPGDPPEGNATESGLLRALLESSSATARSEGRAVTKFQLSMMGTIIGVLWLATLSLGAAIWSDMKARVSASEVQIRDIALDVNTLKGRDGD